MVSATDMPASGEIAEKTLGGVEREQLVILTPVYNDWRVLRMLLAELDAELLANAATASVIVVNDGSQEPADFSALSLEAIRTVEVLHLRRNLGHQRAITVGLAYVEANLPCAAVVVMDADGEDQPKDILRMVAEWRKSDTDKVVFALRKRR